MPTPDDAMVLEHESTAARATCPPEDLRSIAAHDLNSANEANARENIEPTIDAPLRSPTPPSQETPSHALSPADDPSHIHRHSHHKPSDSRIDTPHRDISTPVTTTDDGAEDQRTSQASPLSIAAPLPASPHTSYLASPFPAYRFLPNSSSSLLRPGSRFRGSQTSDRQQYEVEVEVKHIDMRESFMCGYLRIKGLTEDHPSLTTYFEGEIIGSKYTFITQHPEWGSNEKVDRQHWARFPAYKSKFSSRQDLGMKDWTQKEHLFMRWKEYFLVPDHRVRTISGASFEGFYYICFNQLSGGIEGIYFHAKSEKFQKLQLEHVPDFGCRGAIEFR